MKNPSRLTVILIGIYAEIWTIKAIFEVVYQTYNNSVFLFVLNIFCAVVWVLAFFANLKRYCSKKEITYTQ